MEYYIKELEDIFDRSQKVDKDELEEEIEEQKQNVHKHLDVHNWWEDVCKGSSAFKDKPALLDDENLNKPKDEKETPELKLKAFSNSSLVHYFHPLAFVEGMRRVNCKKIGYVDWEFIKAKEGKEVLDGYVPTKTNTEEIVVTNKDGKVVMKDGKEVKKKISKKIAIGKSGVTIASGFDIGQHNNYDLERIFKSNPNLKTKYLPYANKKKQEAIEYLKKKPLSITKKEAELTDKLVKESQVNTLVNVYNKYDMPKEFKFQSIGIHTVVMSISFQYGIYSRTLKDMWSALESGNEEKIIDFWEVKAKVSSYQKRRQSELKYLKLNIKKFK